ncbi:hypothetical protein [Chromohalobacter canadensis]|uniref:Ribbon-helix-helix protein, copG family n=1 Tax=Chromohalobacter canadensis TaxID=141389 RepID=A0ABZ0Y6V2_9GAMM|nr:hypothetical protein [Chromohalobacter canadensis]MCK0770303.1 hypothetical protein [Chromohalobacter canadensis]WQH07768.1 hypothetical protein SR908_09680 [Chromohalobacter canadensis]
MSVQDFINRLEEKRKRSRNMVSMTIRVSEEEEAAIQDLANHMDCTRQEILHDLVEEYLIPAWQRIRQEDAGTSNQEAGLSGSSAIATQGKNYYLLNTNKANSVEDHQMMLEEQVAAAFENGWKQKIERIRSGDVVFLYESGKGVVAYGVASGDVEKAPHEGRKDETYYQRLHDFKRLGASVSAKDIQQALGRKIRFVHTLTLLKDGDKLAKALEA